MVASSNKVDGVSGGPDEKWDNVVLCCDGTWLGDCCKTSNVKMIANCLAGALTTSGKPAYNPITRTAVCYFDGLGMSGSFTNYLLDGALAITVKLRCVEAYRFVAQHYSKNSKVWLFGFSRGAHTVRMVAGMIRNCGILRSELFPASDPEESLTASHDLKAAQKKVQDIKEEGGLWLACFEVFTIYQNRDPMYKPSEPFSDKFKKLYSHTHTTPPIRFMGLFETVGALGMPKLEGASELVHEFYDQIVSSDVQSVYQTLAAHDRMSLFQPCFARRKSEPSNRYSTTKFDTEEVWFPGGHHDNGRQHFVFTRNVGGIEGMCNRILATTNALGANFDPDPKIADATLYWMVSKVKLADPAILKESPAEVVRNLYALQVHNLWTDTIAPRLLMHPIVIKNPYDSLYNTLAASVVRHTPIMAATLKPLLNKRLLTDRHVPLYTEATFYCPDDVKQLETAYCAAGHKSEAFKRHQLLNGVHQTKCMRLLHHPPWSESFLL